MGFSHPPLFKGNNAVNTFNEGDRVYSKTGQSGGYRVYTVTKVHKTGNFVVDNGMQQFRQSGHACGDSYMCVHLLTDAVHAELEATKQAADRHGSFRLVVDKLARMNWRTPVSEDQLERIITLASEMLK